MESDAKLEAEIPNFLQTKQLKDKTELRVSEMSHHTEDDFKPMKLFDPNETLDDPPTIV